MNLYMYYAYVCWYVCMCIYIIYIYTYVNTYKNTFACTWTLWDRVLSLAFNSEGLVDLGLSGKAFRASATRISNSRALNPKP